jgi:K+-transporting ATPase, c chain
MKSDLIKSIKITLLFSVFFAVAYVLVLWIIALIAGPNGGKPEVVTLNGKIVGVANVGQTFTKDIYFWGRPSATNYKADQSGGSNQGPSNPKHLADIEQRIDAFLAHHPYLTRKEVPAEMVTASGSGLDPDITPESAYIQVKRVADARGMRDETVKAIVDKQIEKPFLGIFGKAKVNVLRLNVALEMADKK